MEKRVLITGPRGLVATTLAGILPGLGYEPILFNADISDGEAVKIAAKDLSFDTVIHTAALTKVDQCEEDRPRCYAVNVEGTRHMRDLAKSQAAQFVYISTATVFSGDEGNYHEDDLPYPKNYYNLSKYLGEIISWEYEKSIVLRLNVIGVHPAGSRGRNFLEWLVDSIRTDKNIALFGDVMINPLSNWTAALYIQKIIEKKAKGKILHIGSSNVLSKADIGKMVIEKFPSYKGKVTVGSAGETNDRVFRPKRIWLNTDYAEEKLGLKMPTIESEIDEIFGKSFQ